MANNPTNATPDPDEHYTGYAKRYAEMITEIVERLPSAIQGDATDTKLRLVKAHTEHLRDITAGEPVAPHAAFAALKKAHDLLGGNTDGQALIVEAVTHLNRNEHGGIPEIAAFVKEHAPRAAVASSAKTGNATKPQSR